jgi:hypothetical protein
MFGIIELHTVFEPINGIVRVYSNLVTLFSALFKMREQEKTDKV